MNRPQAKTKAQAKAKKAVFPFLLFFLSFSISVLVTLATPDRAKAEKTKTAKKKIVASTTQIYDFAQQVVGDAMEVESILAPGLDPHTYIPTPKDIQKILKGDILLQNGLHLEGKNWMAKLAQEAGKKVVTVSQGIHPIYIEESPPKSKSGKRTNPQIKAQTQLKTKIPDPHAWFSVPNAAIYVRNILRAVIDLDPENKSQYQARTQLYLQQLDRLHRWIQKQMSFIPLKKRILVTNHDAFNYFCHTYKLNTDYASRSIGLYGWSTDDGQSRGQRPQHRTYLINILRFHGVQSVFVESTINPKLLTSLAKEAGVQIGGSLYSDSMGTTESSAKTYIGMMRENTLQLLKGLL